jgi:hypothetical protein
MMFLLDALAIGLIGTIGAHLLDVVVTAAARPYRAASQQRRQRAWERQYYRAARTRWRQKYGC